MYSTLHTPKKTSVMSYSNAKRKPKMSRSWSDAAKKAMVQRGWCHYKHDVPIKMSDLDEVRIVQRTTHWKLKPRKISSYNGK